MGKSYLGPKILGFSDPVTPKMVGKNFKPQKAHPCIETRVLTYRSSKSVKNCYLYSRKKTKKVRIYGYISPCAMVLPLRGRTMALGVVVVLSDVINCVKF